MKVLDTDILISVLRSHEPTVRRLGELRRREPLATTVLSRYELLRAEPNDQQLAAIGRLLAGLNLLTFDRFAADRAAEVDRALGRLGLRLHTGDTLIAGITLRNEGVLVTRNRRHFDRVPGLVVEDL